MATNNELLQIIASTQGIFYVKLVASLSVISQHTLYMKQKYKKLLKKIIVLFHTEHDE